MNNPPVCPICGESVADYKGPCPKHPMTGDGAVVRAWTYDIGPFGHMRICPMDGVESMTQTAAITEHNCAIRQQAAEIERLTTRVRGLESDWDVALVALRASEARTADLLKALEQAGAWFDEYGHIHQDKPVPDADKAKRNFERAEFCWAAAKGETV